MSASRSSGYAVSRQIFLSLRCERIYRKNLASDHPMQEKPLQTKTTAPPPTDRKGKNNIRVGRVGQVQERQPQVRNVRHTRQSEYS